MLNTILAYCLALPIQCLMVRYDKRFWDDEETDIEKKGEEQRDSKVLKPATGFCEGSPRASSLTVGLESGESSEADESATAPPPPPPLVPSPETTSPPLHQSHLRTWALHNPLLLLSWLCTLTIGLPLRCLSHHDVPLATTLLSSVWLTTLSFQNTIKSTPSLPPPLRALLASLSNAVLSTALAMTAYVLSDAALSARPVPAVLATLQNTRTPLSASIIHRGSMMKMTAGDVATTLLNSGLVAWGLKLYEHRATLLSRAGLTVCSVAAVLALGNIAVGPVVVARMGMGEVPDGAALAFAARSVTIALAGPVMGVLGGDGGLNAAMVVASGIGYQMGMGFGVGRWVEGKVVRWLGSGRWSGGGGDTEAEAVTMREGETRGRARTGGAEEAAVRAAKQRRANDPRTVAAGVTVGVNAAAMGTAYLYETQSEAAPHAALSMIALGIMTVVFSSIPPLARWVVASVAAV